jgi:integrase
VNNHLFLPEISPILPKIQLHGQRNSFLRPFLNRIAGRQESTPIKNSISIPLEKGYGSNMAKLCPPHTLRDLMGHSSIVTTMEYYVQDVDENKKKAVEGLDRMMGE